MRRSGGAAARARAASGFVNAVLRRAAAEREELLAGARRLDPRGRRGRPLVPEWLARDVVGGARAPRGAAADGGDERARGDRAAGQHAAGRARDGSRPSCGAGGSRSRARAPGGLLDPADGARRRSASRAGRARGSRPGELVAAVARLAGGGRAARPAAGRAGARPLRRARGSRRPRSRPGWTTAARSSRSSSTRGAPAEIEALCARAGADLRPGRGRRRGRGRPRLGLRSGPRGPALLRPRDARLAARRALAQVARRHRAPGGAPAPAAGPRRAGAARRAARSSTRPARSRARENEERRRRRSASTRAASRPTTSARERRGSPRAATPASCSCGPTATAPPASSSPASGGARR